LVLDHLAIQQADTDDPQPYSTLSTGSGRRGKPHQQALAQMKSQCGRGVLGDHDFVGTGWIGHAPSRHAKAVLVEQESIDAADHYHRAVQALGPDPSRLDK
jgi:hypothetical protein